VTLAAIVTDVRASLAALGIRGLVLVNGHGGNYILSNLALEANAVQRSVIVLPVREDWDQARSDAGCTATTSQDMHAGELEVSLLLQPSPSTR
jgi:creatinine amidohydrolase